ncbi:LysR family transcriptional regulator [Thiopseudomonas denitrificans]|uniref:DNA-binding transcriptional LysR family regulator n=1 Tax=Thiopseudomonas denitrificans TaxID=1501432 RepID=A0A4R6TWV6_9GAMM|nr:LysR family transcriptional regulator [Thiopseudomonas denitrificans]TDQ37242.1 DNA-binding transcriptional LysR family regulator [Thiopseudomonas denitrificans]
MNNIVASGEQLSADDLLIFARVAELGSFTAAGERLGRPKSTISRRISALEEQLGERLLMRTTRQMHLTDFGRVLLEHAQQVAHEVSAAWALSEQRKLEPSGRLRVSIPSDFANLFLVEMLAAFSSLHPQVSLELDLSSRRVDLLAEGFDLAVRIGQLTDDALLVGRKLAHMGNGLYASPEYLRNHAELLHPDDLQQHQTLQLRSASGQVVPWQLINDAQQWTGEMNGRIQANTSELLMHLACNDAGIVALPHSFVRQLVQSGRLQQVLPDWRLKGADVWAVFPGRRLLPAKTRAFIEMLVVALKGM